MSKIGELFTNITLFLTQNELYGNMQLGLKRITSGVPQGSALGLLLFSMVGNGLFSVCRYTKVHAYADDIQLYVSNPIGLSDRGYKLQT